MLIVLSIKILIVKLCDLEKVIDLFGLDVIVFCINNNIKEKFISLCDWGIGVLVVNFIFFIIILFFRLMFEKLKLVLFFIVSIIIIIFIFLFVCINIIYLVIKCLYVYSLFVLEFFFYI